MAMSDPVSPIPVSYIRVKYIQHNIFEPITTSLCLTRSIYNFTHFLSSLCSKHITVPIASSLCSTLSYITSLSDNFTMRHANINMHYNIANVSVQAVWNN